MFEQMSNIVNPKYRLFNKMFKHIVYNRFFFFYLFSKIQQLRFDIVFRVYGYRLAVSRIQIQIKQATTTKE